MPKFLIEPDDLPSATLELLTSISAGRGWLDLVKKALEISAGEPILSIKEKAGTLTVQILTKDLAKLQLLEALREASTSICEICGESGTLTHHQTRCEDHAGWRTSPPFPPEQRGYIEACEWEETEPVGLEFGSVESDLLTRELARRNGLWALDNPTTREQATQDLLRVWRADRDYPLGPAAGLTAEEIGVQVPATVEGGAGALVRFSEIPEPWATRFQVASLGATHALDGYYVRNWEKFLERWSAEAEKIEDLVERELERAISNGFRQAVASGKVKRAELGVDDADLAEFVRVRVEKGRWPEGDLLEAFRVWRDQKNTSNAAYL